MRETQKTGLAGLYEGGTSSGHTDSQGTGVLVSAGEICRRDPGSVKR
jgi:hypothetical protein